MAQTPSLRSDLLESRLRAHHASASTSHRRASSTRVRGRDDSIFDSRDDDDQHRARQFSGREYMSSPLGPSTARRMSGINTPSGSNAVYTFGTSQGHSRHTAWREGSATRASARRTSGTLNSITGAGSTPRTMGARELEDHVDKLSKQNFDLKLEVYHRRAKIDELELRMAGMHRLEEDNLELQEVNEELVSELEKRDRAVDEAVVLICDLEDRVRGLEEELRMAKMSTQLSMMTLREESEEQEDTTEQRRTPDRERRRRAEFTTPEKDRRRMPRVPSFIQQPKASSVTLRSMYMHEGKTIRAIPSVATMRSTGDIEEPDEEEPQSPVFSVLSRSDLGSLYEREDSSIPQSSPSRRKSARHSSVRQSETTSEEILSDDTLSQEGRFARVDRWVSDRAISPPMPYRSPRGAERSAEDPAFQSLSSILAAEQGGREDSPLQKRRRRSPPQEIDLEATSPFFGENQYSPTPDVNTVSTTRHSGDNAVELPTSSRISTPSLHDRPSNTSTLRSPTRARVQDYETPATSTRDLSLPWEMEAYTGDGQVENMDEPIMVKKDSAIGVSTSGSSPSDILPQYLDNHDTTLSKEEGIDEHSPTRTPKFSSGNRRLLAQRGRSFQGDSSPARPSMSPRVHTTPTIPRLYIKDDEEEQQDAQDDLADDDDLTLHFSYQPKSPPHESFSFSGFERSLPTSPISPTPITAITSPLTDQIPITTTTNPTTVPNKAAPLKPSQTITRTSSLRQRMKRFVRRTSTSKSSGLSSHVSNSKSTSTSTSVAHPSTSTDAEASAKSKRFKQGHVHATPSTSTTTLTLPLHSHNADTTPPTQTRPPMPPTSHSLPNTNALSPPTSGRTSQASGLSIASTSNRPSMKRMHTHGSSGGRASPSVQVRMGWPGAVSVSGPGDSSGSFF